MRIEFQEGGYIELFQSDDTITIIIQALDATNSLKTITNACELTTEQFQQLCDAINAK